MPYFVYIVECNDTSFYTGITTNVERRVNEHNKSTRGAKYVKRRLPVKLVYFEEQDSVGDALKREREIKGWPKTRKVMLVHSGTNILLKS